MWKIIIICITIYSKHFQVKGESHTQMGDRILHNQYLPDCPKNWNIQLLLLYNSLIHKPSRVS